MSTRSSAASSAGRDTAHAALRAGTAAAHARTDALFSRFNLASPDGYRAFLRAHVRAFLPVEVALDHAQVAQLVPDWTERRRATALMEDCAALNEPVPPVETITFDGEAALLGALYVLEGSRLGGAVLARRIGDGLPRSYLGSRPQPGSWRKLLELLQNRLYDDSSRDAAIACANSVFARFETAARDELER